MPTDHRARFAERLASLIDKVPCPATGGKWSTTDLWKALTEQGTTISLAYVGALRRGQKSPSPKFLEAFAQLFDVPVGYFIDDAPGELAERLETLADVSAPGMRKLVVHARGLSAENLDAVINVVDQLRRAHGLPPAGEDDVSPA